MSPGKRLSMLIETKGLAHVMAAHSPLSACLAQEAGFDGLWASGFELSALMAVPDMSIVSMSQHLDMVRAIAAATTLPVIADIDTGFGNAINVHHAVRAYEAAGAAAVVIEDKAFPKVTSLADSARHALIRSEEFQGKIEAAIDARRDADFCVIARTEALIAGLGEDEAIRRAKAYEAAGAGMILVHSRQKTSSEIESFARRWDGRTRLVIVPTAYPELGEGRIRQLETIAMVIYANHGIRACVTAMREVFQCIRNEGGIKNADRTIVAVAEIFRLQGMEEAVEQERLYLR
ncbi:isocitrate lyase/phosphoenolpyruvate mutase family protein [Agrobacterium rhizogenes]|uniref:isocitrate lyase/phosphoenolpyruvate mutase family protein n=1 Tax=Rhizobium rhizogenes TaxID=359 RepID=UPI0022B751AD|nr:isocitrate lyase/phosphoenolpyruvate mutase family protein [Rhizobium rhizogenes]MCZ7451006.1 isocitrate lyase/phosphoenolpyruvate mutase family protein [Rhizobium rhizogenes]